MVIGTLLSSDYTNPNGPPFMLNIKINIENHISGEDRFGNDKYRYTPKVDIKMPVNSYLTFNFGRFSDRYLKEVECRGDCNGFSNIGSQEDIRHFYNPQSKYSSVIYAGLDFHIPLYKLWK